MIRHGAYGVRATRIFDAWICAGIVATRFTGATVIIRVTGKYATIMQTDMTEETIIVYTACQHTITTQTFLIQSAVLIESTMWQAH